MNAYLPVYLLCPDCGGREVWTEAGRMSGSHKREGHDCPDCRDAGGDGDTGLCSGSGVWLDGCGSTFVDTRCGYVGPVPAGESNR